jgi:hypothetical protein
MTTIKKSVLFISIFCLILFSLVSFTFISASSEKECTVINIYEASFKNNSGAKVLTKSGKLDDIELILVPTQLDKGNYKINVSSKGSNLFKVENTNLFIETNFCYEYCYWQEVILNIENSYGNTKGKIIYN